jgi:hypothetical protein
MWKSFPCSYVIVVRDKRSLINNIILFLVVHYQCITCSPGPRELLHMQYIVDTKIGERDHNYNTCARGIALIKNVLRK